MVWYAPRCAAAAAIHIWATFSPVTANHPTVYVTASTVLPCALSPTNRWKPKAMAICCIFSNNTLQHKTPYALPTAIRRVFFIAYSKLTQIPYRYLPRDVWWPFWKYMYHEQYSSASFSPKSFGCNQDADKAAYANYPIPCR